MEASSILKSGYKDRNLDNPFGFCELSDESRELLEFKKCLIECLQRHRGFADIPSENVPLEFRNGLLGTSENESQSYGLEVPYLACYDEESFLTLQAEVLSNFPDWNIQWAPACSRIYVDRVITDEGELVSNLSEYVRQLKESERVRREKSSGVLYRQLVWLQPQIPEMLAQLSDARRFVVAAVVDRVPRKSQFLGVWILSKNDIDQIPYAQTQNSEARKFGSFPINEKSEVFRKWRTVVGGEELQLYDLPYCLYCWGIPKDEAQTPIEIVDPSTNKTTNYKIRAEEIIRDADIPDVPIR